MSTRHSVDEESTEVRRNGGDRDEPDLSRLSDRELLERTFRRGIETDQRVTLTFNALQAHREDEAKRWRDADRRHAVLEEGLFELVASDRARRKEAGEIRASIAEVKADLEKKVAAAQRISLVDEQERAVVVEAARAHVGLRTVERTKQNELVVADAADALQARKERRSMAWAGVKKAAPIVLPILTAAAGVLAALIAKGC